MEMKRMLRTAKLHTICEEARCPNIAECFGRGTAVFLILGNVCTRGCRYCNVNHGTPLPLNKNEPRDVAESVKTLGLSYVVVTSVTRDDLEDGGASVFYETVQEIRRKNSTCNIEVLIPDFRGNIASLQKIVDAAPDVINHNIDNVIDITLQAINIMGNKIDTYKHKETDILIEPEVGDVGMMDFSQKKKCMQAGIKAAKKKIGEIKNIVSKW